MWTGFGQNLYDFQNSAMKTNIYSSKHIRLQEARLENQSNNPPVNKKKGKKDKKGGSNNIYMNQTIDF